MALAALMLGSIGTVVETSGLQREAFNLAFEAGALDWHWDEDTYAELLKQAGGERRIERYAESRGERVDASTLHAVKTERFHTLLRERPPPLRDGLGDLLHAVRQSQVHLVLASTTDAVTVQRVFDCAGGMFGREQFDFIGHRDLVDAVKPDPAIYRLALDTLGLKPAQALCIEDNPDGLAAALAARLPCIAFPGAAHADSDFEGAAMTTRSIAPAAIGLARG